jgi:hypothetical protein
VLALIVGILVLDLTVQGVHITNQTVIYRVKPEARNRLTAGYMTSYFIGAAGSLISASAWQHAGWAVFAASGQLLRHSICWCGGADSIARRRFLKLYIALGRLRVLRRPYVC